jgi:hypothetical protein
LQLEGKMVAGGWLNHLAEEKLERVLAQMQCSIPQRKRHRTFDKESLKLKELWSLTACTPKSATKKISKDICKAVESFMQLPH